MEFVTKKAKQLLTSRVRVLCRRYRRLHLALLSVGSGGRAAATNAVARLVVLIGRAARDGRACACAGRTLSTAVPMFRLDRLRLVHGHVVPVVHLFGPRRLQRLLQFGIVGWYFLQSVPKT